MHVSLSNSGPTAICICPYWINNASFLFCSESPNKYLITRGEDGASRTLIKIKWDVIQTSGGTINITCIGSFNGW